MKWVENKMRVEEVKTGKIDWSFHNDKMQRVGLYVERIIGSWCGEVSLKQKICWTCLSVIWNDPMEMINDVERRGSSRKSQVLG